MPITITDVVALDIRFPTSLELDGSDAMNEQPDYSAAYVTLRTDQPAGLAGHGLTFTSGRGNELCVAAIESLAPLVAGRTLEAIVEDLGGFWMSLANAQQLRWVGPEKGVIHLATAAIVNAVWDLYAKVEGKPLWKLLADMSPEALVRCIPFRHITDMLTPDEALELLRRLEPTRAAREAEMRADRVSRIHDLLGLARVPGRQGPPPVSRGSRRRLDAIQAQGRARPGRRPAPRRDRPRGDRPRRGPDGGRQPGLGCGSGDRLDARAGAGATALDRGAHEPGRRPWPRAHRAGARAAWGSAWRPASTRRTG